ncbi:MAG: hypothetical protein IPG75_17380 [Gemmatimonadetes bacterium]|nr:hypothetical protein [Gemmatimonadota bacterium]
MPSFRRSLVPTFFLLAAPLAAQDTLAVRTHADSVSIRFIDADLRAVVQALGRFMPKPLMVAGLPANRVSLETPAPVARGAVLALLRGLVESQNLSFEEDSAFIRIGPADRPTVRPSAHSADSSQVQLFVLRLKHARAADVAATVNLLFGASGEFSGQGGMSRGTLSDELRRNGSMPVERRNDGTSGEAGTVPSFPRSALSGPVTLVPDELTNALLVRATAADFSLIRAAVEELDLRPLQVLVEVLIVEARRTHDFSVGTTLFVPPQGIPGDADGSIGGQTRGAGLGDVVLRVLNLGRGDIDATLSASETGATCGSSPARSSSPPTTPRPAFRWAASGRSCRSVVSCRPTTTTPTGWCSTAMSAPGSGSAPPSTRTATSRCRSSRRSTRRPVRWPSMRRSSPPLGGLQDDQRDRGRSGVPLLSGLPLIGPLFGAASHTDSQTELYLFITPRILRTDEDADRLTAPHLPAGGAP